MFRIGLDGELSFVDPEVMNPEQFNALFPGWPAEVERLAANPDRKERFWQHSPDGTPTKFLAACRWRWNRVPVDDVEVYGAASASALYVVG